MKNVRFNWLTFVQRRSLRTKVTFFTLVIYLLGIWALAFYGSQTLRDEMQQLLSGEQMSAVSLVAAEIERELDERLRALEAVAARIDPPVLTDAAARQALLEQFPLLQRLFNGGVILVGRDGTVIADFPSSVHRKGINYLDRNSIAAALEGGRSSVGQPLGGRRLPAPEFEISAPIHDGRGAVIGAVSGVTSLAEANFLRRIIKDGYGKTGYYVLVARESRFKVAATNQSLTMTTVPAPGVNAMFDRFLQGFEGSTVALNPFGLEVLASARRVAAADWYLVAALPTAEAFAPIRAYQRHMLLVTSLLTLLAGVLIWWMLSRQLAPILGAVKALAALPDQDRQALPLPIRRPDEVGELIGAFNRLLETLHQKQDALTTSVAFTFSILDSIREEIAVLNADGVIVAANRAWRRFGLESRGEAGSPPACCEVGADYFGSLAASRFAPRDDDARRATEGIRAVLNGSAPGFAMEYPCHSPEGPRWFGISVTPLDRGSHGAVVAHTDITARKQAEARRLGDAREHRDALVREVHHRIKNNLQSVAGLLRRELGRFAALNPRLEAAITQVHAIAAVHGLQAADTAEAIPLCHGARDICASVAQIAQRSVLFRVEGEHTCVQPMRIAGSEAVSVALVLNELILNAVKHAPPGSPATTVRLFPSGAGARIVIRNAVASPPTFDLATGAGLGTGLGLVLSLLPERGAHLRFEPDTAGFLDTVLQLTAPTLASPAEGRPAETAPPGPKGPSPAKIDATEDA